MDGVYLESLSPGAIVGIETRMRHYRIEYLAGDDVRISGHPSLCPSPSRFRLHGCVTGKDELKRGFIGRGMRLVFGRPEEGLSVTTSEITSIRVDGRDDAPPSPVPDVQTFQKRSVEAGGLSCGPRP